MLHNRKQFHMDRTRYLKFIEIEKVQSNSLFLIF